MKPRLLLLVALAACGETTGRHAPEPEQLGIESPYEDNFVQLARYTHEGRPGPQFVEILDVEALMAAVLREMAR